MKKRNKIILISAIVVVTAVILYGVVVFLSLNRTLWPAPSFPENSVWVCEELNGEFKADELGALRGIIEFNGKVYKAETRRRGRAIFFCIDGQDEGDKHASSGRYRYNKKDKLVLKNVEFTLEGKEFNTRKITFYKK